MKKLMGVLVYLASGTMGLSMAHAAASNADVIQLNNQIQAQLKQLQSNHEKEMNTLNSQIQNQIKQMQTTLEAQIQKLNNQTQAQMRQMQSTLEADINNVQAKIK